MYKIQSKRNLSESTTVVFCAVIGYRKQKEEERDGYNRKGGKKEGKGRRWKEMEEWGKEETKMEGQLEGRGVNYSRE